MARLKSSIFIFQRQVFVLYFYLHPIRKTLGIWLVHLLHLFRKLNEYFSLIKDATMKFEKLLGDHESSTKTSNGEN
jgi:hypothetical protein